jgi:hypothetical protein
MRKLKLGFLSIDANMFATLLILPIVKLEQLEQKFFEFLGTRVSARIANSFVLSFSHLQPQSVGAPTVYVLLDSSCCHYCYITPHLVGVPNWFVNSCRLRVQLQEWRPCNQHQGRRLSSQAACCIGSHEKPFDDEDKKRLVEEGAKSPSPILNILLLNLQSATSTSLYAARFWRWV